METEKITALGSKAFSMLSLHTQMLPQFHSTVENHQPQTAGFACI
jgi:hypothetical protein